jgi:F-type H+-transporting ATPase subunit delta
MNRSSINTRYAKAYVERACETGVLNEADHDIRILHTALIEYKDFKNYIQDHVHSNAEKNKKIDALFSNDFTELTIRFIQLVLQNGRVGHLLDICRNIIERICTEKCIIRANLTCATEINTEIIEHIREKFEEKIESTIELTTDINPLLIGGFLFTINGTQYDASIATRLKSITKHIS